MRHAKDRAFLAAVAAVAAVMITSAALAAPQDGERSYLPPQSSRSQDATKSEEAPSPKIRPPRHKVRARTRRRHFGGEFQPGPPDMFIFPDMLFFPFF
jgi:hypothetical protein